MRTVNIILSFAWVVLLCQACNPNSKKLRLESGEETVKNTVIESISAQSELVLDTIIPNQGIKFKESRKSNPQQPPIVLDFTKKLETKKLDMANYYKNAKFVKLKYPFPDKGSFLYDTKIHVSYERGASSMNGFKSSVRFAGDKIIAGDAYMGFHCYDISGTYIATLASPDELPDYDKVDNKIEMQFDAKAKRIGVNSVFKDKLLMITIENNKAQLFFYNTTTQKNYLTRPLYSGGQLLLLSDNSFADYRYSLRDTTNRPFMFTFDIKGDTLCSFTNYNPKPVLKNSAATNPDYGNIYYYNDMLTIRQAYSDTVYRLKSASELEPSYIMNFGAQKLDVQTALYGNKVGKLIPYEWIETDGFVFFVYTENYDSPNNRENGTVHFFYSFYDKNDNQLYQIEAKGFPEDYWIGNSIENASPFTENNFNYSQGKLFASYTKKQLEAMMKNKNYQSLSASQQAKMKELYDELAESELLIMILE